MLILVKLKSYLVGRVVILCEIGMRKRIVDTDAILGIEGE